MKKGLFLSVALVGILGLLLPPAAEAKELRLKWGATSVRSSGYAHTVLYAKAVNQAYPGQISVTVVETGGNIENLSRMRQRLIHLGQTEPVSTYTAYHGLYDFKDQKNPNLRMLFVANIQPFTFVAGKETGVTALEGLSGIKMASNPATTSERLGRLLLEANGITPEYKWGGTASNLEAMKAKTVDAWSRPGFRDGGITEVGLSRPLSYLPVTDEHLKKFNEKYPAHGKGMTSPGGMYKGQDSPYQTLAFVEAEMVDKDVPEDVVYKILKAVHANRLEIAKVDATQREGGFADFPKLTLQYCDAPLHPGAIKFYRELGLTVPARLVPAEAK